MTQQAIQLTRDQRAVAQSKILAINKTLGTLYAVLGLGRPALDAEFVTNCLTVAEGSLSGLSTALGFEADGTRAREPRNQALRAANPGTQEPAAQRDVDVGRVQGARGGGAGLSSPEA